METVLRSPSRTVVIGPERPFCVIGERINPTGRKAFAEELRGGDLSTVAADAVAQVAAGADMLDVNAGIAKLCQRLGIKPRAERDQPHGNSPALAV